MTVQEAMVLLSDLPPDAQLCIRAMGEYIPVRSLVLRTAYHSDLKDSHSSLPYFYKSVEFPSDYNKTKVVSILPFRAK